MIPARARELLEEVRPLADAFAAADARIFLVGGVVRDLFVDDALADERIGDDIDLTTDAQPARIKAIIGPIADAVWTQGERFGTIGCTIGGRTFEITTHRAEAYTSDSRKPQVAYTTDIEVDLSRRDFTVNAMALEVTSATPALIDPFGGLADLAAGVLRTPLDPDVSFSDDPLRMLRAARFTAGYGLEPTPELVAAVRAGVERLEIVSAERIRDELCKLVTVDDPSAGLWFVHDTGLSDMFLPELPAMRLEQDPIHRHKDVLSHTIAVVAKARNELKVRLAALFHDVGKPKTRSIGGKGVSFHHHEVVGARMTRDRMKALRFSNEMVQDVTQLVYLHLRFHTYQMGWTDAAVRRFVRDAGPLLPELIALTRADCTTRNKKRAEALDRRIDDLEERIAALQANEELAAIRPDLDGQQVMSHLGIPPGREVGRALEHLLELRLEHGPLDEARAYAELDAWWAARSEA
ncbi:CCA tRNA nucleotidyltransferase [Dermatobacter hominis]|uniref:CCA tRNA nucleotidyltransferase n=1 Tax=Dermatobacter hominis TaxID=2884263 RepID=UPI001D11A0A8|nr:CCA tRNA nucleotidyltransferase [Dermatobacter hominis]UDY34362.1 CCA tRNA nucleotidyltransferase [Dermatobacter hominis]